MTCDAGFADCNGIASDGCETDLSSSPQHCGLCGNTCGGGESCIEVTDCGYLCSDTSSGLSCIDDTSNGGGRYTDPTCALDTDGLLRDGEMNLGLGCWYIEGDTELTNSAQHADETTAPSLRVVGTGEEPILIVQSGFALEAGRDYRLILHTRSNAMRTITVQVQEPDGSAVYGTTHKEIATGWALVILTFRPSTSTSNAALVIDFGSDNSTVWLDGLVLEDVTP